MSKCIDLNVLFVKLIHYSEVEVSELLNSAHLTSAQLFIFHQQDERLMIDEHLNRNVS